MTNNDLFKELKEKDYESIISRLDKKSPEEQLRLYDLTFVYHPSNPKEVRKKDDLRITLGKRLGY